MSDFEGLEKLDAPDCHKCFQKKDPKKLCEYIGSLGKWDPCPGAALNEKIAILKQRAERLTSLAELRNEHENTFHKAIGGKQCN